jgi:hypothetical protein
MLIENTYGNNNHNLRNHFKFVKSTYGKIKALGIIRFEQLRNNIIVTLSELLELTNILVSSIKRYNIFSYINYYSLLESVHLAVIDEGLIAYNPSIEVMKKREQEGEPIPKVYIPRKPHPNGLLAYILATYVKNPNSNEEDKKLPLIIDLLPRVKCDLSPFDAFTKFIDRYNITYLKD